MASSKTNFKLADLKDGIKAIDNMAKKQKSEDDGISSSPAPQIPGDYTLLPGERYTTDVQEDEHPILSEYYTGETAPEQDADTELKVQISLWFDLSENKVKRFMGTGPNSENIWKEDATVPKYVIDTDTGECLGMIISDENGKSVTSKVKRIAPPKMSFDELLDSLGED